MDHEEYYEELRWEGLSEEEIAETRAEIEYCEKHGHARVYWSDGVWGCENCPMYRDEKTGYQLHLGRLRSTEMSKTWVYSDPHFGHANICKFTNYDGTKVRPWDDVTHMNEALVSNYNAKVHPDDRVYILGDFAMSPGVFKSIMPRLLGRKVLVPGNHEPKGCIKWCAENGVEVRGYVVKKGFIMSHIPIHPGSLSRWQLNIHGHLHNNQVELVPGKGLGADLRYYCACVERTGFAPILLDDILKERNINQQ